MRPATTTTFCRIPQVQSSPWAVCKLRTRVRRPAVRSPPSHCARLSATSGPATAKPVHSSVASVSKAAFRHLSHAVVAWVYTVITSNKSSLVSTHSVVFLHVRCLKQIDLMLTIYIANMLVPVILSESRPIHVVCHAVLVYAAGNIELSGTWLRLCWRGWGSRGSDRVKHA